MLKINIEGTYIADLTLWWLFTSWMAQFIAVAGCPVGTFGYLCSYTCHCAFDTPCDAETGACFDECAPRFTGKPYCQLENIAKGKPTYQETSITDNSALAVDGNRNQTGADNSCSWSVNFRYPFRTLWRVDLQDVYSVNKVKVFFRNDSNVSSSRRTGARVYVTTTEEFHLEPVCYTSHMKGDVFFNPPSILELKNCTHRGQFVTVYNQRPVVDSSNCPKTSYSCWANLELCEVEVYVCSYGTFGENCDKFCHCKGGTCDQRTGLCPGRCLSGWIGSECDMACTNGTYGENCDTLCGKCINGEACDVITGKCLNGCEAGWKGAKCTKPCPQYTYGFNCSGACFNCANLTDCDKKTGICPLGCAKGFFGSQCSNKCPAGSYGKTCQLQCGRCAGGETCNSHTGECPRFCEPGYAMPLCQGPCPVGSFGENCSIACGNCRNYDPCNHITGECTRGCGPGWSGLHCVTPCKHGYWGYDCAKECRTCSDEHCDHVTGICIHDCKPGYQDPKCDRKCPSGLYGSGCTQICGQCADHASCDSIMGHCPTECSSGWRGTHCNIPCSEGFYGDDCKDRCGHCHNKTACDPVSGKCQIGCQDGYHGLQCRAVNSSGVVMSGGVIGCLVGVVVVIALIVVTCSLRHYMTKRSRKADKQMNVVYNNAGHISAENEPEVQLEITNGDMDNDYYNVGREARGIPVSSMKEYLRRIESDSSRYKNEFEELRNDVPIYPHLAGQKAENKAKNRFLTTFPYDHSRVALKPLQGEAESDYINANFIDSVESRKVYIAAQGPNRLTVRDFWRMIWQEKVGLVVMLANVYEDGKVKCEKYWPETKPLRYCEVLISLDDCKELSTYTVRHMTVGNVKTSETRKVIQFHFTGWPDHGVPDTMELVEFHRKVMSTNSPQRGPLLVHCSAGVGRTGTFIGLDALFKYGTKSTHVDIHNFVRKMRECRMTMVQNVEQYRLLHVALLEAFNYRHTSINRTDFSKKYEEIKHDNKHLLKEEFKQLTDIKPSHSNSECSTSLCQDNIQKNRALDVLPVDRYRPFLSTHIHGTNDYINGIILPSYSRGGNYIVTQTPLVNTVVDFWRLLFDHECKTIVSLNLLDEEQEETGVWWPSEGESVSYGPLKIKTESVSDIHDSFTQRTFSMLKRNYGDPRTVRSFHFTKWPVKSKLPISKHSLLSLLDTVERWKNEIGSDTVVVQCMNGANCSGLYCGISLILDNLRLKQEVDVYHAVQKIQSRREQFINSSEQYEYLYEIVSEYINSRDIYGNLE
ncbi:receptor-type tyrosine-protein phosphatase alpha-like [Mytilus californianus]|uniref:receptor-type tyrosine-protein phosphatase alpha-like n=1 Tax=Mytilus californianus TaxID=6549 RepID=UPI0022480F28|nr:receptor-type tyrosine-protein phosphatase alpha-like [Mytilus californianus]